MAFSISYVYEAIDKYSGVARKVNDSLKKTKQRFKNTGDQAKYFGRSLDFVKTKLTNVSDAFMKATGSMAAIGVAIGAPLLYATREAIKFEEKMAEVRKVVDDLSDPKALKGFGRHLMEMSKNIPLSVHGLADIAAAGGRMGLTGGELADFVDLTAKMSVAFDTLPEEAGTAIAKFKNIYGMTLPELQSFGDVLNHLSNNEAVTANELIRALMNKGASAGKALGISANATAGMSAQLIALGMNAERVGYTLQTMAQRIKTGKAQKAGLINTNEFLKDPTKGLTKIFDNLRKLPESRQADAATEAFGEFGIRITELLAKNPEMYKRVMAEAMDAAQSVGSMEKEFRVRSETTANKIQLAQNALQNLSIEVGDHFKGALDSALVSLTPVILEITEWIRNNPKLTKQILFAAAAIGAVFAGLAALGGLMMLLAPVVALIWEVIKVIGMVAMGIAAVVIALGGAVTWGTALLALGVVAFLAGVYGYCEPVRDAINSIVILIGQLTLNIGDGLVKAVITCVKWVDKLLKLFYDLLGLLPGFKDFSDGLYRGVANWAGDLTAKMQGKYTSTQGMSGSYYSGNLMADLVNQSRTAMVSNTAAKPVTNPLSYLKTQNELQILIKDPSNIVSGTTAKTDPTTKLKIGKNMGG